MEGQAKKIVYELIGAFIVILLLILLRPLFIEQIAQASEPYNIPTISANGSIVNITVTPKGALSYQQADIIYNTIMAVIVVIVLIIILLTTVRKI